MELSYKKTMSRVGLCYFVLMTLTLVLQSVCGVVLTALWPQAADTQWYAWVVSYVPLYCIAVPLFLLMMSRLVPTGAQPAKHALALPAQMRYIVLAFGVLYLCNYLATGINLGISALTGSETMNPLAQMQQMSSVWMNILFGCIVAPVGEEYLFRMKLYDKIGAFGQRGYVLMGGLIFGLFHGNLSQFLYAFMLGAMFCYIYAKTGNILYTMALHIIVNLVGMVVAPLALESTVALAALGFFIIACIIAAIVILWRRRKQIVLEQGTRPLPEHPARAALLNAGMLLYILVCLAVILVFVFYDKIAALAGGAL